MVAARPTHTIPPGLHRILLHFPGVGADIPAIPIRVVGVGLFSADVDGGHSSCVVSSMQFQHRTFARVARLVVNLDSPHLMQVRVRFAFVIVMVVPRSRVGVRGNYP